MRFTYKGSLLNQGRIRIVVWFTMSNTLIITHTDMDGVASAALYIYLNNLRDYRVYFTEPYNLHEALERNNGKEYSNIVITDIGVNPIVFERVKELLDDYRRRGSRIYWFDHHVWSTKWIQEVRSIGVELYIDESTCATGVVYKYSKHGVDANEDFASNLVNGVCAGDLWRFDHWLGPYYIRLIRRKDSNEWRRRVLSRLTEGVYWDPSFNEKISATIDLELGLFRDDIRKIIREMNGFRACIVESNENVENSFLASFMMGRFNTDVAVIASSDGKLSFRSRGVNVRDIAVALGGGGHLTASGARVNIPWRIRVLSKISREALLKHIASRIEEYSRLLQPI